MLNCHYKLIVEKIIRKNINMNRNIHQDEKPHSTTLSVTRTIIAVHSKQDLLSIKIRVY